MVNFFIKWEFNVIYTKEKEKHTSPKKIILYCFEEIFDKTCWKIHRWAGDGL
jgi:hypothetical protein